MKLKKNEIKFLKNFNLPLIKEVENNSVNKNWKLNVIHKYGTTKSILDMYSNWSTWGQGVLQPIVVPDTIELLVERILQDNAERILKKDFKAPFIPGSLL